MDIPDFDEGDEEDLTTLTFEPGEPIPEELTAYDELENPTEAQKPPLRHGGCRHTKNSRKPGKKRKRCPVDRPNPKKKTGTEFPPTSKPDTKKESQTGSLFLCPKAGKHPGIG